MLKVEDLTLIAYAVNDAMMDINSRKKSDYRAGMEITIKVKAEEMLAMDEELYRAKNNGDIYGFVAGDEVSLSINRINFRIVSE